MASGKQQAQVTEPLTAAQARQKSLAVWVAPVAQVLLETKQVPSSSTEQSAMLVCHTSTAESEVLEGRTCCASSSTCATSAAQTANDFCLACAAVSGLVSRTCSGADANQITRLS